jgi:hypothetical protein
MNTQVFDYAKQFTDNAFKAQAAMLKSFEQAAGLQLKAFEQHATASAAFISEAMETRDFDGARALWEKGVGLNRELAERAVTTGQDLFGLAQNTAETLGTLGREQQQAATNAATKAASAAATATKKASR